MKLYGYWLGLYPLDWEFCFMPVQTYKNFITEQYHKNPAFYSISAGSIEKVLTHIDVIFKLDIPPFQHGFQISFPAAVCKNKEFLQ